MRRRFAIFSSVFLLATICGVVAFYVWKRWSPDLEPFDEARISTLQIVPYCEVKHDPTKYDGRLVKIDAQLHWFDHGYFFRDEACAESIDRKYLDGDKVAVLLEKTRADLLWAQLETFQSPDIRFTPINIVAVGRFTFRTTLRNSDAISARTPFHFELFSIERATPEERSN